jgi:hypothetical protein
MKFFPWNSVQLSFNASFGVNFRNYAVKSLFIFTWHVRLCYSTNNHPSFILKWILGSYILLIIEVTTCKGGVIANCTTFNRNERQKLIIKLIGLKKEENLHLETKCFWSKSILLILGNGSCEWLTKRCICHSSSRIIEK